MQKGLNYLWGLDCSAHLQLQTDPMYHIQQTSSTVLTSDSQQDTFKNKSTFLKSFCLQLIMFF